MRRKELEGTRNFLIIVGCLALAVAAAHPFLSADPEATWVLLFGFAVGMIGALRTALKLRNPETYSEGDSVIFGLSCLVGGACGVYYFGFFSPASVATAMGTFYFGLSRSDLVARTVYGIGATVHGVLMALIISGVIEDHGVIRDETASTFDLALIAVLIELVFGLTYFVARGTAKSLVTAIEELDRKVREVSHREALLQEARRELDTALKVGGPGRFTEQRLGSYELGVLCGRGAMSEVYEAFRIDNGEPAAVKLLNRDKMGDPQHLRRFLRELRITAQLDLPHVVKVHEVGDDSSPIPYLAMELLHGTDLAQILREQRQLEHDIVIDMLEQVGRGVDAAHAAGVVHRDLKPQNLFRHQYSDGRHEWKILDFGVSRLLDGTSSLTDGHAVGTPSYMAPEQARGKPADHRADLFALGVVAYRSLVGRPAFGGSEIPQIMQEVVFGMPPQPSLVGLPVAVDDVLAVALAKSPADRFPSAAAFVAALSSALDGEDDLELGIRAERLLKKLAWGSRAADR